MTQTKNQLLSDLRAATDATRKAFDLACKPHYADGRWGAYRAWDMEEDVPADVEKAMNAHHAALHRYYMIRDGSGGFIGKRKQIAVFSPMAGVVTI